MRTLGDAGESATGLDIKASPFTSLDVEDVVSAHLCARRYAATLGFGRYIVSATSPFLPEDLPALNTDAPGVVARRAPGYAALYKQQGWRMFDQIGRVYVNDAARHDLDW